MNPLKQLYELYSDANPVNAGLKVTYVMLKEDSNWSSCVSDIREDVECEREKAFCTGFNTAVKLLTGAGNE